MTVLISDCPDHHPLKRLKGIAKGDIKMKKARLEWDPPSTKRGGMSHLSSYPIKIIQKNTKIFLLQKEMKEMKMVIVAAAVAVWSQGLISLNHRLKGNFRETLITSSRNITCMMSSIR
jgi:hypothetical protein